jgi:hypothetical protein
MKSDSDLKLGNKCPVESDKVTPQTGQSKLLRFDKRFPIYGGKSARFSPGISRRSLDR